ncbi:hypothetical protein OQA88_8619 [Cercophora sp. LCS_1]
MKWWAKTRLIWSESRLNELLGALRGQQTALNLMLQLLQIDSLADIQEMLRSKKDVIEAAAALSTSLRSANPSIRTPRSLCDSQYDDTVEAISALAPSEIEFGFDDDVVTAHAYRRVLAQAQAMTIARSRDMEFKGAPSVQAQWDAVGDMEDLIDLTDNMTIRQNSAQETHTARFIPGPSESELLFEALGQTQDGETGPAPDSSASNQSAFDAPGALTTTCTNEEPADESDLALNRPKRGIVTYIRQNRLAVFLLPISLANQKRCDKCNGLLCGIAVRLEDEKFFHKECFKCSVLVSNETSIKFKISPGSR